MESFKIKDVVERIGVFRSEKLRSLIGMCQYIWGDEYSSVDEYIYIKNLYNCFHKNCTIEDIEIYVVHENKFYVISYEKNEDNTPQSCLKYYNLQDIESVELKEHKRFGELRLNLTINFKCKCSFTLNNSLDTYDDIASNEYSKVILDIFKKIK